MSSGDLLSIPSEQINKYTNTNTEDQKNTKINESIVVMKPVFPKRANEKMGFLHQEFSNFILCFDVSPSSKMVNMLHHILNPERDTYQPRLECRTDKLASHLEKRTLRICNPSVIHD